MSETRKWQRISPEILATLTGVDARATISDNPRATMAMTAAAAPAAAPTEVQVVLHRLPEVDPRLVLLTDPTSERASAYRVLAHRLAARDDADVISVTSPRDGDGKTTCAMNLALALAEGGRAKVLLLEASVHRPAMAQAFRVQPPWCFSEQLAAHRQQPLLHWSAVELLGLGVHACVIDPRTKVPPLLDAVAFEIAVERLRGAGYQRIVIDAPSVLAGIEANLVQDAVDGTLLVARAAKSRARDLRRAVEQLTPGTIYGVCMLA